MRERDLGAPHVAQAGGARRRGTAVAAIAVFCAAPFAVFYRTVDDAIRSDFRFELGYLVSGWGPWVLIVVGSVCMLPVAVSIGRSAFSRWWLSPVVRHTYAAWGISLYLLGLLLAVETSTIARAY
jgi:hypothetical protein